MNLQGKINLLKLENSGVMKINGHGTTKLCIVIPIEENDIYLSVDKDTDKAKSAWLSLNVWQNRTESGTDKYGNTHSVKQAFSKQYKERMGEGAIKEKPFIGNMKIWDTSNNATAKVSESADVGDDDELPF